MLFNSFDFLIFLIITFLIYWFVFQNKLKYQNIFLWIISYIFYGWWDWRFLILIFISSFVDYIISIQLDKTKENTKRKHLLLTSLIINLGTLGFFKYFNFFSQSFADIANVWGWQVDALTLNIILPVGISFYTFQTMSYTIDVYRSKLKPTYDIVSFFTYVSFFPQLVAGPIERATHLLPQFYKKRKFNYDFAADGMRQILWGLFKKVVVADNAAIVVNHIFANYQDQSGINLFLGVVLFAFQIYGDFSGYSDIAIGTARLFGFDIMQNFAYPYFSRDIAEFWRRWHISLSSWFRDYIYFPLGGSHGGLWIKIRNTFIIFIVSGFWHGANYTFIAWGALNALYFLPLIITSKNRRFLHPIDNKKLLPSLKELLQISFTFLITTLAWVFFRSETILDSFYYIKGIFTLSFFSIPNIDLKPFIYIFILLSFEWTHRHQKFGLQINYIKSPIKRGAIYMFVLLMIFLFSAISDSFIYFQF